MDNSTRFWDRAAARYASSPIKDEAAYQQKLTTTQEFMRPDMRVLEFGCGTGSTAMVHAPYVAHIHGIDISAKMIEIAQAKTTNAHIDNLTFQRAGLDDLDAPAQPFDMVLGLNVLHLLDSKEEALTRVSRLLKPGGIFVSSTVCLADWGLIRGIKYVAPIAQFFRLMPQVKVFSQRELSAALINAKFEILHESTPQKGKGAFIVARSDIG